MTREAARLQEARDRLYSVVDHMIDGIVTFDDGGSIESANPAAQAMFGSDADHTGMAKLCERLRGTQLGKG